MALIAARLVLKMFRGKNLPMEVDLLLMIGSKFRLRNEMRNVK
jgi:hypothetical protein